MKALSGLGESNESNILMAKLAVGEARRTPLSSDSDISYDSDRDCDTAENRDKIRLRKRDKRKARVHSPRTEKQYSKVGSSVAYFVFDLLKERAWIVVCLNSLAFSLWSLTNFKLCYRSLPL